MLGGCVEEVLKKRNKDHKIYVVAFLGADEEKMNKEMIEESFHRKPVGLMGQNSVVPAIPNNILPYILYTLFGLTDDVF